MAIGKFHGVMMPTTPTGSRVSSTSMPGRVEGSFSPASRSVSPEKKSKICAARSTSPTASGSVLPSSRASSLPSSSLRVDDLVRDLLQDVMALLDAGARPCRERRASGCDGLFGLLARGARITADDVAGVGGIDVLGDVGAVDPAAGDEVLMDSHEFRWFPADMD